MSKLLLLGLAWLIVCIVRAWSDRVFYGDDIYKSYEKRQRMNRGE